MEVRGVCLKSPWGHSHCFNPHKPSPETSTSTRKFLTLMQMVMGIKIKAGTQFPWREPDARASEPRSQHLIYNLIPASLLQRPDRPSTPGCSAAQHRAARSVNFWTTSTPPRPVHAVESQVPLNTPLQKFFQKVLFLIADQDGACFTSQFPQKVRFSTTFSNPKGYPDLGFFQKFSDHFSDHFY